MTPLSPLSPREAEIVGLYASGARVTDIARQLGIHKGVVGARLANARDKYRLSCNMDLRRLLRER